MFFCRMKSAITEVSSQYREVSIRYCNTHYAVWTDHTYAHRLAQRSSHLQFSTLASCINEVICQSGNNNNFLYCCLSVCQLNHSLLNSCLWYIYTVIYVWIKVCSKMCAEWAACTAWVFLDLYAEDWIMQTDTGVLFTILYIVEYFTVWKKQTCSVSCYLKPKTHVWLWRRTTPIYPPPSLPSHRVQTSLDKSIWVQSWFNSHNTGLPFCQFVMSYCHQEVKYIVVYIS